MAANKEEKGVKTVFLLKIATDKNVLENWIIEGCKKTERKKLSFRCDKKFKFENEIKKF